LYFSYLYPRVDANVSKGINHLLKAPFCVHPKSGKVCVTFDPLKVELLDVNNVPTLTSVIAELNSVSGDQENQDPSSDRDIPCLREAKRAFDVFLRKVRQEAIEKAKKKEEGIDF